MKPDIFQKALRATAQVACCALLLACPKPTPTPDEKTVTAVPADPDRESDSAPAAAAPMSLEQCKAHTNAVFTAKTEKEAPYTKECCQQIAQEQDKANKFGDGWPERSECCQLLDWRGSAACTPWGPPCPPAMGEA